MRITFSFIILTTIIFLATQHVHAATKWPLINELDTTFNISSDDHSITFSIPLLNKNGKTVYTLFGTGGNESYLDSLSKVTGINHVGPLQLRLVEGTEDSETSLLAYDDSPPWHTRGQVHFYQLVGDSAKSQEFGTLRHFLLRGFELTLEFTVIETDKNGIPASFKLNISIRKCEDCNSQQAELPNFLKGEIPIMRRDENGSWYESNE